MAERGVKNGRENGRFVPGSNGGFHGKPGRSGRLPSDVRELCREKISKYDLVERLALMAKGMAGVSAGEQIAAMKVLMSYGFGAPTQVVEHTGKDGGPIEFVEHAKAEFEGRITRMVARLGSAGMPEGIE